MTRLELEARRMQAIPDLDSSMMQAKIARRFGVSRTTVSRWKRARAQGSSLQRLPTPGRPPRLTPAHIEFCTKLYQIGPRASGYNWERWTQVRFAKVIYDVSKIEFHPDHVGKLMHDWGLRPKRERKERI